MLILNMVYTKGNYIYSLLHSIAYFDNNYHHQKIGKTRALRSRYCSHNTSHLHKTFYKWILLIKNIENTYAEKIIHNYLIDFHLDFGAGTEFYDGCITLDMVKRILDSNQIEYDEIDVNNMPPDEFEDDLYDRAEQLYNFYETNKITDLDDMIYDIEDALTIIHNKLHKNEKELRNYQKECVDVFVKLLEKNEYFQGIYCLATGLGKSVIMWHLCLIHLKKYRDDNILILTFRKDIYDSIKKNFDMDKVISLVDGEYDRNDIENAKGKIIIMLRQKLISDRFELPDNVIHGIFYDESHDGATVDISTYETLSKMNETQNLKYRIGFSATPLTEIDKQNEGVKKLYGKDNNINYLYTYGIIEGIQNGWLCKFTIDFMNLTMHDKNGSRNISEFFEQMEKYDDHINVNKKTYCELLSKIKKAFIYTVYKKGIMWMSSIKLVDRMYDFLKEKLGDSKVMKSHSKYNNDDDTFMKSENNCLMIACDKFTTGYDTCNLDIGFNFVISEAGNRTAQKLGRLLRPKYGYEIKSVQFYQLCEIDENKTKGKILGNIIKNIIGLDKDMHKNDILDKIKKYICDNDTDIIELGEFDINIDIVDMD